MGNTRGVRPPLSEILELLSSLCRAKALLPPPPLPFSSPPPSVSSFPSLSSYPSPFLKQPPFPFLSIPFFFSPSNFIRHLSPASLHTPTLPGGAGVEGACGSELSQGASSCSAPGPTRGIILPKKPLQPRGRGCTA